MLLMETLFIEFLDFYNIAIVVIASMLIFHKMNIYCAVTLLVKTEIFKYS